MRERAQLAVMRRLASVQRARRSGAEAAMTAAASERDEARSAEEEAEERSRAAQRLWSDYLAQEGFSPELSRGLSAHLIDRHEEAGEAARTAAHKAELHEQRQQEWQLLEALVRQGDESVRRLGRKVGRRTEEKRLMEIGDRITFSWRRR